MPWTGAELVETVNALVWPMLRISAMLFAAPILGSQTMPVRVRVLLSGALAALVAALAPAPVSVQLLSLAAIVIAAHEVLIGIAMGFCLQLVFSAFAQAGESMALTMGLGFASMVDPQNGLRVPVVSQYYVVVITLLFLALDGHLIAIEVLIDSFRTLPAGGAFEPDAAMRLVEWGSRMFAGAVLIALPVVASQLLVYMALGIITRAAPQLNIFAVGFPMLILAGFIMMLLALPTIPDLFRELMFEGFALMRGITAGN